MKHLLFLLLVCFVSCKERKPVRYILYDVNPGEGFNLRRDVYMRMAVFVKKLNIAYPDTYWVLVLPPWGHLYHWQSRQLGHQARIPWGDFFSVSSLGQFVPVMEFGDWVKEMGGVGGAVYYLQGYKEGWKDGKFEEKFDLRECLQEPRYHLNSEGVYEGQFFYYDGVVAEKFACLSVQGHTSVVAPFVRNLEEQSVMLDRAENLLHDWFGDVEYWGARRSMRFSEELVETANRFRREVLGSDDVEDNTVVKIDWRDHIVVRGERGGQFGCVHLRRGDFARSRRDQVPSIRWAGEQLRRKMEERKLEVLFVSSDATKEEFSELSKNAKGVKVVRFEPTEEELELFKDGGVAIIDQSICSHAKYFIGSKESTFTFRIQEEREIMGFELKDTFDMLCGEGKETCEKGTQWKIEWGTKNYQWKLPSKENQIKSEL
eukprot:GFUD01042883.1.p1 GENE.GFUD01042883.1~~GFUD01042883.1.p1  ORF type:complete len:431 (+),score=142.76 GFUD01042883.1:39-1331(+)